MDNDYALNLDEILRTIATADVLRIRFLLLNKRLLVDMRHSETEGPLVRMVPRLGSSEESFRHLKRLRPHFPVPDRLTAIWWPKYVSTLSTTGIWQALMQRIADTGYTDVVRECEEVLTKLKALERQEIHNAISGEGFRTIWQRSAT